MRFLNEIKLVWAALLLPAWLVAQTAPEPPCSDKIYLRDGSIFIGQITAYDTGNQLVIKTHNGWELTVPTSNVKKIVQKCGQPKGSRQPKNYDFRERGFYQHTRLAALPGYGWSGERAIGFLAHHSLGFQFSRKIGAGIGIGSDVFGVNNGDFATFPVFAEARTYLLPQRITPYFSVAGGWAFAGKALADENFSNRIATDWSGGWMAQARAGYRIGNHFTFDIGLRWQQKNMDWRSRWNPGETGTDKILNQRLDIGLGIIF